jgi:hypothetical protein
LKLCFSVDEYTLKVTVSMKLCETKFHVESEFIDEGRILTLRPESGGEHFAFKIGSK